MMHSQLDDILNSMFQYLPNFFQNETSEDNMYLAQRIMFQIDDMLTKDMLNEYYHLPRRVYEAIHEMTFDELKRTDASNVDGKDNTSEDTDSETAEVKRMPKIVNQKAVLTLKWNFTRARIVR